MYEATRWTQQVEMEHFTVPVLVFAGANHTLMPPEGVSALAEGLGAKLVVLDGLGHGVALDPSWLEFCGRIHAWLRSALNEDEH